MAFIQASVGESKIQFSSIRVFQKLYKAQAPLLWCSHMQPKTPPATLDVITRSCSSCKTEGWQGCGAGVATATKASQPWGAQDMQELQQKHCQGGGLSVGAVKH